jgi:hypothetical protein
MKRPENTLGVGGSQMWVVRHSLGFRRFCELVLDKFPHSRFQVNFFNSYFGKRLCKNRGSFLQHEPFVDNDDPLRFEHTESAVEITFFVSEGDAAFFGEILESATNLSKIAESSKHVPLSVVP